MIDIPRDEAGRALTGSSPKLPAEPVYSSATENHSTTNPLLIAVAWIVVGVPLAWGVTQTGKTSFSLFRHPPARLSVQH